MNAPTNPDVYGTLIEPTTLKIQRMLPGPIERVWAYLTDSELRRKWLAAGAMEMQVGAPFELVWRNDELTDPPGERPAGFGDEHRMQSRITELDPPRKLCFAWKDSGDVSIELEAKGDEVRFLATDLEAGLRSQCVASVAKSGSLTLPAKKFYEIVKSLPETDIRIAEDKGGVKVAADRFDSRMQTLPREDFPTLPEGGGAPSATLPRSGLKEMVAKTQFAITGVKQRLPFRSKPAHGASENMSRWKERHLAGNSALLKPSRFC